MRKLNLLICSALILSACSAEEMAQEETDGSLITTTDPAEVTDGWESVANDGTRTEVLTGEGDAALAGSQGNGEQVALAEAESAEEFERLSALPALDSGFGIESIIGSDDRRPIANTTTYPERAQVLVVLPRGRCSGVMVARDLVLTAGHCVHSGGSGGSWMTSATVFPGRNGSLSPFGSCSAKRLYSVQGWVRDRNPGYDFGAIKLNCSIGNNTGWLGAFSQSSVMNITARISSYPGDKPLEQWTHTDKVRWQSSLQTGYQTDTMPGNSGSGAFAATGVPAGCGGPCVHTVHAYGAGNSNMNKGTRLTRPLIENLRAWINAN